MAKKTSETFTAIVFGDPHIATRPPGWRTPETWGGEFESLIRQIHAVAKQFGADRVCCTGDWFHSKAASSHEDVLRAIRALTPLVEDFGPVLSTIGNHDMVGHNIEDAARRQPIAVLAAAGLIRRVDLTPEEIKKGDETFLVNGIAYAPGYPRPAKATCKDDVSGELILTHHDLYLDDKKGPAAVQVLNTSTRYSDSDSVAFVNGHIHDDQGIAQSDDKTQAFVNAGSLARVSLSEADLIPVVALVRFRDRKIYVKLLSLQVAPASEAFAADADAVTDPRVGADLDAFLKFIDHDDAPHATVESLLRSFAQRRGDPEGVIEAAASVLASVSVK